MWNNTDKPLALFITFRARGTWLHGDDRGAIDRHHNTYRSPRLPPNPNWKEHNKEELKGEPGYLNATCRRSIKRAVEEVCRIRGWSLLAINVRTNHVHIVINAGDKEPSRVLHALKSNATRQMRTDGQWPHEYSPWVDKGSNRRLWNEMHIAAAVDYVLNRQGGDLPDFDRY